MHYCILVIGENPNDTIFNYNENLEGCFLKKRSQIIGEKRDRNKWYKEQCYDIFIADEKKYREKHINASEEHFEYVKNFINEFNMTDDEIMEAEIKSYEIENDYISDETNKYKPTKEGIYSKYNNFGKWDWYQIGGRWVNSLKLKNPGSCKRQGECSLLFSDEDKERIYKEKESELFCDSAAIKDIDWDSEHMKDFSCYGIVLENGDWYDKDYCVINNEYGEPLDEDEMKEFINGMLESLPETTTITIVDIHV
jgi:hypothetical protein